MNYLRLQKILPSELRVGQHLRFQMAGGCIDIEVLECAPYTTMLDLRLSRNPHAEWAITRLQVRMYHDAEVAEVLAGGKPTPFRARYHYPNSRMHHRDEKAQLNRYLGEWLSRCLSHGHQLTELAMPV
ncbi:DUF1249 domain-containing protein [Spongiibacter sp. KMU-158]|uniref:DUF1249 domain-containing protein n=2 Tax=Spongiibacter pelagi TaxID=2760804 RepID=A0A927GUD5_9GAMM|nr:DUF1249 domain-containing protein [Spongiibacter pelagi]